MPSEYCHGGPQTGRTESSEFSFIDYPTRIIKNQKKFLPDLVVLFDI